MKTINFSLFLLLLLTCSFQNDSSNPKIIWTNIEKVEAEIKKINRPLMIFISSVKDYPSNNIRRNIFKDSSTVSYLNQNFHCSEIDYFEKNSILFLGNTFKYIDTAIINYNDTIITITKDTSITMSNDTVITDNEHISFKSTQPRYHQLVQALLDGKKLYPCFVFFDKDLKRITILPGTQSITSFNTTLHYIAEGAYLTVPYDKYKEGNNK